MAQYSGSIDISMIADIENKNIVSIKNIYHKSKSTNINDIPEPKILNDEINNVINVAQGAIGISFSSVAIEDKQSQWSYDKPLFEYGYHLWCSLEMVIDDGSIIYSTPFISADWESYYNVDIGGTNLIRNSKTLIDERIYFD